MLHDIGTTIDYDDHHKHSRYLILNAGLPGFSPRETALIGQMARYHRKGTPTLGQFRALGRDGDERAARRAARRCCGSPSSSSARATRRSTASTVRGRRTAASNLQLEAHEDVAIARWAAERQRDVFKKAFGRELEVSEASRARTPARR